MDLNNSNDSGIMHKDKLTKIGKNRSYTAYY